MAVVDETVFLMLICGLFLAASYAAYLRLFTVRRLRRRVDQLVDQRLPSAAAPVAEPERKPAELGQVNRRLEVLERIVTDGGLHTAAQIEALRAPREAELQR